MRYREKHKSVPVLNHHGILLAITVVAMLAGAAAPHFGQTFQVATEDGDKPIGTIDWIIQEVATGKVLDQGRMAVRLRDVSLQESPVLDVVLPGLPLVRTGERQVSKRLRLNDQLALGMYEVLTPHKADKSGLGLSLLRPEVHGFGQEYFDWPYWAPIFLMRLFQASAIYKFPNPSTATPNGKPSAALTANPPSPEYPGGTTSQCGSSPSSPMPANVDMLPSADTFLIR
jgi:hypothetical protein